MYLIAYPLDCVRNLKLGGRILAIPLKHRIIMITLSLLSLLSMLGGLIAGIAKATLVNADRIEDEYI